MGSTVAAYRAFDRKEQPDSTGFFDIELKTKQEMMDEKNGQAQDSEPLTDLRALREDLSEAAHTVATNPCNSLCCLQRCEMMALDEGSACICGTAFVAVNVIPVTVELNVMSYRDSVLRGLLTTTMTTAAMLGTLVGLTNRETDDLTATCAHVFLTSVAGVLAALTTRAAMRFVSPLPRRWFGRVVGEERQLLLAAGDENAQLPNHGLGRV